MQKQRRHAALFAATTKGAKLLYLQEVNGDATESFLRKKGKREKRKTGSSHVYQNETSEIENDMLDGCTRKHSLRPISNNVGHF